MLRNVPNSLLSHQLQRVLQLKGYFPGTHFDFFYLPMDLSRLHEDPPHQFERSGPQHQSSFGYAFIHFLDTKIAEQFRRDFDGLVWSTVPWPAFGVDEDLSAEIICGATRKTATVVPAKLQALRDLVDANGFLVWKYPGLQYALDHTGSG